MSESRAKNNVFLVLEDDNNGAENGNNHSSGSGDDSGSSSAEAGAQKSNENSDDTDWMVSSRSKKSATTPTAATPTFQSRSLHQQSRQQQELQQQQLQQQQQQQQQSSQQQIQQQQLQQQLAHQAHPQHQHQKRKVIRYARDEILAFFKNTTSLMPTMINVTDINSEEVLDPVAFHPLDHDEVMRLWNTSPRGDLGRGRGRPFKKDDENPLWGDIKADDDFDLAEMAAAALKFQTDTQDLITQQPTSKIPDEIDLLVESNELDEDTSVPAWANDQDNMKAPSVGENVSLGAAMPEPILQAETLPLADLGFGASHLQSDNTTGISKDLGVVPEVGNNYMEPFGSLLPYLHIPSVPNQVDEWLYYDLNRNVQGIFPTSTMRSWHESGYFTPDLLIKISTWSNFYPLIQVYPGFMDAFSYIPDDPAGINDERRRFEEHVKRTQAMYEERLRQQEHHVLLEKQRLLEEKRMQEALLAEERRKQEQLEKQRLAMIEEQRRQQEQMQLQALLEERRLAALKAEEERLRNEQVQAFYEEQRKLKEAEEERRREDAAVKAMLDANKAAAAAQQHQQLLQQQQQQQQQQPSVAPWAKKSSDKPQKLSLLDVQKQEEENAKKQQLLIQQQQQQQQQQMKGPWNASSPQPSKSLLEVQQEEERKRQEEERRRQEERASASPMSSSSTLKNVLGVKSGWGVAHSSAPSLLEVMAEESQSVGGKDSPRVVQGSWAAKAAIKGSVTAAPLPPPPAPTRVIKQRPDATAAVGTAAVNKIEPTSSTADFWNEPPRQASSPRPSSSVIPADLADWCVAQLKRINGSDDISFIEICMTLPTSADIREFLADLLGSTPVVSQFATEFIKRKEAYGPSNAQPAAKDTKKKVKK